MAKIRLLDILEKDHGTGPISLVQEMERSASKGKIRLLDQVRCQGKDNEVLVRYHIPELKENFKQLGIMYTEADFNRYLAEQELDEVKRENDELNLLRNLDVDEAYERGIYDIAKNAFFHTLIIPGKGKKYYERIKEEEMRRAVAKHPKFHTVNLEKKEKGKKGKEVIKNMQATIPGIKVYPEENKNRQALGTFRINLERSKELAHKGGLDKNKKVHPIYAHKAPAEYYPTKIEHSLPLNAKEAFARLNRNIKDYLPRDKFIF